MNFLALAVILFPLAAIWWGWEWLLLRWREKLYRSHFNTPDKWLERQALYIRRRFQATAGACAISIIWLVFILASLSEISPFLDLYLKVKAPPARFYVIRDLSTLMKPLRASLLAPSPVQRDETFDVLLRVSPATASAQEIREQLQAEVGRSGEFASELVRYEPAYVATLTSRPQVPIQFEGDSETKAIRPGETIEWRWHVTATRGSLLLTATLNTPVLVNGIPASAEVLDPPYRKSVTVIVTPRQRIQDALEILKAYWPLVLGTLGALGWIIRRWQRRRRDPPPPKSYEVPA